jgi:hypothetical protein
MSEQTPSRPEGDAGGGRSARGPSTSVPGGQEPGGVTPPYEGRKRSAEPDQEGGTVRGGVRVGGATGPVEDDQPKAPRPEDTVGGRTASPADEQPAAEQDDAYAPDEGSEDTPTHVAGTPRGERGGA